MPGISTLRPASKAWNGGDWHLGIGKNLWDHNWRDYHPFISYFYAILVMFIRLSNCQCAGFPSPVSSDMFLCPIFTQFAVLMVGIGTRFKHWQDGPGLLGLLGLPGGARSLLRRMKTVGPTSWPPKIESLHMLDTHILNIPHSPRWLWSRERHIFSSGMPHDSDFCFLKMWLTQHPHPQHALWRLVGSSVGPPIRDH